MRYRVSGRTVAGVLCFALLLFGVTTASAQKFETRPVDAVLGEERDPGIGNKIPPLQETLRTPDGKVRVIVQLTDPPLALFEGATRGRTRTGKVKVDPASPMSREYRSFLRGRQEVAEKALRNVARSVQVNRRYSVVFNGFSIAVQENELAAIAAMPEVVKVFPDKMYYSTMDASLPLINAPEFWAEFGGRDNAGTGIKVAVIDGGIRPENPMFDGTGFSYPPGFPLADDYCGTVDPGFCNGKLISARHFRSVSLHPDEVDTPLGINGHGTHVAGSAVGNFVAGAAAPDGVPEDISGVAPGAWLMVYKALWWNGTTGSGSSTDLIAAMDAAVADGADVINNSWGGSPGEDPNTDAFGPTFDAAWAAGVVVVTAAGNSGPGATSIGCPGCQPSTITVANSTTNRLHSLGFDITSPAGGPMDAPCLEGTGPSLGAAFGPKEIVYAGDVGDPEGCSAFPAGSMTGAMALISRGSCTFLTKVLNAEAAGAEFTVVFNNVGGAPITMGGLDGGEAISSCMISNGDGIAARDFVQANLGSEGFIAYPAARYTNDDFEDLMATSSSRGPNGDPDSLKPDISAPGTRILSAWSPDHPTGGSEFIIINGTSMASPHVAGAAALMLQQNPGWTPDQVKSALMSTSFGGLLKEDAATPADPFDRGAGRVDLDRARQAGATFDLASMAEDECFLGCSFTRTIRNELGMTATWQATVETVDPALEIFVAPDSVTLAPGESASFEVDVYTALVNQGQWQFGGVNWADAGGWAPTAHLPIAVYATDTTDGAQLTKTVDKAVAPQLDTLTYDIQLSNLFFEDTINLVDEIPAGTTYVPGSAMALVDGVPDPSFVYDAGTNSVIWSGQLDPLTLEVNPGAAPFGYVPLDLFFAPLPCSSVCDDTSISLSGFGFEYVGETYAGVVMSSNGFIVAGSDTSNAFTPSNQFLPDPAAPNNVIAPFWTDIDMDGTSATDSGAGIWYAGILTDGVNDFLAMEWQAVELFGSPGSSYTFQIWITIGTSDIYFVYSEALPDLPGSLTVGVEDADGVAGNSYYYNGVGTEPVVGTDLQVLTSPGGSAQFTFQVEASCLLEPVINVVEVSSDGMSEMAFAVTDIVPGADNDNDGVPDECSDLCWDTVIPEGVPTVRLGTNRWALIDDDYEFDTNLPGGGTEGSMRRGSGAPVLRFSTTDTAGCSCEQIIEALHLGNGHKKFGCSIGAMRRWVDQVR